MCPIYEAAPDDVREIERAAGICLYGVPMMEGPPVESWQPWVKDCFVTALLPHLTNVMERAHAGELADIVALDRALVLPPAEQAWSVRRGKALLETHGGARHLKLLTRLLKRVEEGACPGHFATAFAVRAAAFTIGTWHSLQAFLFSEWSARQPAGRDRNLTDCLQECASLIQQLSALIQPHGHATPPRFATL